MVSLSGCFTFVLLSVFCSISLGIYAPSQQESKPSYISMVKIPLFIKNPNSLQFYQNYSKVLFHNKNSSHINTTNSQSLTDTSPETIVQISEPQNKRVYPVYSSSAGQNHTPTAVVSQKVSEDGALAEETLNERIVYKRRIEKGKEIEVYHKCPSGSTGQFVYDASCNQYLDCWKGRGGPRNCAPGTLFNPKTLECDFPDKVECLTGPRENSFRSPKSQNLVIEQATCPDGFSGLLPNYTDCSKFVQCNDGQQRSLDCPPGTLFDFTQNICDFPEKSVCFGSRPSAHSNNFHQHIDRHNCKPHDKNCYREYRGPQRYGQYQQFNQQNPNPNCDPSKGQNCGPVASYGQNIGYHQQNTGFSNNNEHFVGSSGVGYSNSQPNTGVNIAVSGVYCNITTLHCKPIGYPNQPQPENRFQHIGDRTNDQNKGRPCDPQTQNCNQFIPEGTNCNPATGQCNLAFSNNQPNQYPTSYSSSTNQYHGNKPCIPDTQNCNGQSTGVNVNFGVSSQPPSGNQFQTHGFSSQPPSGNQFQTHGFSSQPPSGNQFQTHVFSSLPPSGNQFQTHGFSSQPPSGNQFQTHGFSSQPPSGNQFQTHGFSSQPPPGGQFQTDGHQHVTPCNSNVQNCDQTNTEVGASINPGSNIFYSGSSTNLGNAEASGQQPLCNPQLQNCNDYQHNQIYSGVPCNPSIENCGTNTNVQSGKFTPSGQTTYYSSSTINYLCNPRTQNCGHNQGTGANQQGRDIQFQGGCNPNINNCYGTNTQTSGTHAFQDNNFLSGGTDNHPHRHNTGNTLGRNYHQSGHVSGSGSHTTNYQRICNINDPNCRQQNHTTNINDVKGRAQCPLGFQGITKHPSNCKKFLNCANGITYIQDCADGTLFNPSSGICDFASNVDCEYEEPVPTTSIYDNGEYYGESTTPCYGSNCHQSQGINHRGRQRQHYGVNTGAAEAHYNTADFGNYQENVDQNIDDTSTYNHRVSTHAKQNIPVYIANRATTQQTHHQDVDNIQVPSSTSRYYGHYVTKPSIERNYDRSSSNSGTGIRIHHSGSLGTRNQPSQQEIYQHTNTYEIAEDDDLSSTTQESHIYRVPTKKPYTKATKGDSQHQSSIPDYVDVFDPTDNRMLYVRSTTPKSLKSQASWPPPYPETDTNADYVFEYEDGEPVTLESANSYLDVNVKKDCKQDDFRCTSKLCVSKTLRCNGVKECPNGKDEISCEGYIDQFQIHKNKRLEVLEKQRWDNVSYITCAYLCLDSLKFECKSFNYRKIDRTCFLTDRNIGLSGSLKDFYPCDYYELKKATLDCSSMHICPNGKCLTSDQLCNGINDCGDRADEKGCIPSDFGYGIQLVGGGGKHEGRVEITVFGQTGFICDDQFGILDANVVCRELGFKLGAVEVKGHSHFARELHEKDTLYIMDDITCIGNETSLLDCDFAGWGIHNCKDQEIAGVVCKTSQEKCGKNYWKCDTGNECVPIDFVCDGLYDCSDNSDEDSKHCEAPTDLRLANGSSVNEGRIEIQHHGIWGTVCDDDFNDDAAKVVCTYLGYVGAVKVVKDGYYGPGLGPIWLDQVSCYGNETTLENCTHWKWGEHNCDHSEDVGVICTDEISEVQAERHSKLYNIIAGEYGSSNYSPEPVSCGYRKDNLFLHNDDVHFRVVQGSVAKKGEYPWQAALRVKRQNISAHWCGAVIVSSKWILTAAHCLDGYPKGAYVVVAGEYNTDENEGTEQQAYIEEYYIHEEFREGHKMANDIALLKLKGRGFVLNQDVQPVCLPDVGADYENDLNCTISGFGSVQSGSAVYSHTLRAAWIPIQKMDICAMPHVYGKSITDGMICAGYLDGGIDACDGDSGGPLACLKNGVFTLYGITSWGQRCGYANKPGVYVKVAYYRKWIDDIIQSHP